MARIFEIRPPASTRLECRAPWPRCLISSCTASRTQRSRPKASLPSLKVTCNTCHKLLLGSCLPGTIVKPVSPLQGRLQFRESHCKQKSEWHLQLPCGGAFRPVTGRHPGSQINNALIQHKQGIPETLRLDQGLGTGWRRHLIACNGQAGGNQARDDPCPLQHCREPGKAAIAAQLRHPSRRTMPETPSNAPGCSASDSRRSGLVGGGNCSPVARRKPKRR